MEACCRRCPASSAGADVISLGFPMALCPNFGTESPATSKFCPACGGAIEAAPTVQAQERRSYTLRSHRTS